MRGSGLLNKSPKIEPHNTFFIIKSKAEKLLWIPTIELISISPVTVLSLPTCHLLGIQPLSNRKNPSQMFQKVTFFRVLPTTQPNDLPSPSFLPSFLPPSPPPSPSFIFYLFKDGNACPTACCFHSCVVWLLGPRDYRGALLFLKLFLFKLSRYFFST